MIHANKSSEMTLLRRKAITSRKKTRTKTRNQISRTFTWKDYDAEIIESRNENFPSISATDSTKPRVGMFNSLECMLTDPNPVRLTIFLNFLLSCTDKANILFFYIITGDYMNRKVDRIDLQRWAYEIHSTFTLDDGSPLFINISDVEQHQISRVLQAAELTKVDESTLRHVFDRSRQVCATYLEEQQLPEFMHQKELGIASIYGDGHLSANSDRTQQLAFVEKLIMPHLERCRDNKGTDGSELENKLLASCLVTFLRRYDIKKSQRMDLSEIDIFLRRDRSFFHKGKDFSRRINQRYKQFSAGHCLTTRHFNKPTHCSLCSKVLFGIAPQGYFCLNCDMCFDEECLLNGDLDQAGDDFKCSRGTKKTKGSGGFFSKHYTGRSIQSGCSIEGRHSFSNSSRDSQRLDLNNVQRSKSDRWPRDKVRSPTGHSRFDNKFDSRGVMSEVGSEAGDDANKTNSCKFDFSSQSSTDNCGAESNVGSVTSVTEYTELDDFCADGGILADDSDAELDSNHLPALDTIVEDVKDLSDRQLQRHAALLELYHTERTHLKSLKILRSIFRDRMQQFQCISKKELDTIFPNLDELIEVHTDIKHALRKRYNENVGKASFPIADVLLEHFSGYRGRRLADECSRFIIQQENAMKIIKQKESIMEFSHFLRVAEMIPICRKLGLKDYLPCVMSRVPKYKLMFEQIWKYTDDEEEKAMLAKCMDAAVELNVAINEGVRSRELQQMIVKIKKNLFINMPDCEDLTYDIRKGEFDFDSRVLVYNSLLTVEWPVKEVEFEACLFSDALVLFQRIPFINSVGSDYRYVLQNLKTKRENSELEIVVCPYMPIDQFMLKKKAGIDNRAFFLVSKGKCRQFLIELRASSKDERDRWFSHVAQCQERAENEAIFNGKCDEIKESGIFPTGQDSLSTNFVQSDDNENSEDNSVKLSNESLPRDSLQTVIQSIVDTHGRMKEMMESWPLNLQDSRAAETFFNMLYQQVLQMDHEIENMKRCIQVSKTQSCNSPVEFNQIHNVNAQDMCTRSIVMVNGSKDIDRPDQKGSTA